MGSLNLELTKAEFMMGHFESAPMTFFTENLVAVNGWLGRTRTEIRLSCGFGPSFIVKDVEEFKPKRDANFTN